MYNQIRGFLSRTESTGNDIEPSGKGDELCVDVGGGHEPLPGYVNVDPRDGLDEVDEWGTASNLPFEDSTVDRIHGNSIIPHIKDLNEAMDEFHRILKPGGELILKATHAHATMIVADPDHNSWSWTSDTPAWYDRDSEWTYYSDAEFDLVDVEVIGWLRPYRWWLRPASFAYGKLIDLVKPDIADELMKMPFAGGRVIAIWQKPE